MRVLPHPLQVFIAIFDVGVVGMNWIVGNVITAAFVAVVTIGLWWSWGAR